MNHKAGLNEAYWGVYYYQICITNTVAYISFVFIDLLILFFPAAPFPPPCLILSHSLKGQLEFELTAFDNCLIFFSIAFMW